MSSEPPPPSTSNQQPQRAAPPPSTTSQQPHAAAPPPSAASHQPHAAPPTASHQPQVAAPPSSTASQQPHAAPPTASPQPQVAAPPSSTASQQPQVAAHPPSTTSQPQPEQAVPQAIGGMLSAIADGFRNSLAPSNPPQAASIAKDTDVGKLYPWTVEDRRLCTTWLCPLEGVPTENDPECPLCYQKVPASSMLPCPRCKKKVCVVCYLRSCSTVAWQRRVYGDADMLYDHVCCSFCRYRVNIDRLYQLDNWYAQHMDEIPFHLYPPMPPLPPPPTPPRGLNVQSVAGQAEAAGIGAIAAAVNAIGSFLPAQEESIVDINAINIREQILMLDMIRRQQAQPQATQPAHNQSTNTLTRDTSRSNVVSAGTEALRSLPPTPPSVGNNIGQPPAQQGAAATGSQQLQPVSRRPPSTGAGSNASNTSTQQGNQNTNIGQAPAQRDTAGTTGQLVSTGQPPVPGSSIQVPQQAAAPNSAVHQMASGVNRLVSGMLSRLVPNTPDSGAAASTPATNNATQQETQAPTSSTNNPTHSASTGAEHAPSTTAAPASTAPAPSVPPAHADNNPNDPPSLSPQ